MERPHAALGPTSGGVAVVAMLALLAGSNAGCAASPATSTASAASALTVPLRTTDVTVVSTRIPDDAPPGSDAEPRFSVEIRTTTGLSRTLERPVLGAVSWNAGAAVLGVDRVLTYERVDGFSREVARDVAAPPTSSTDRSRLAYTVHTERGFFDVVAHDGSSATRVAAGLASAGAFRFSDDARLVAFVAAENGGIAGAWVARSAAAETARCLTACDLRVGDPSAGQAGGLLGPRAAEDFVELSEGILSWRDAAGTIHTSTWEGR